MLLPSVRFPSDQNCILAVPQGWQEAAAMGPVFLTSRSLTSLCPAQRGGTDRRAGSGSLGDEAMLAQRQEWGT